MKIVVLFTDEQKHDILRRYFLHEESFKDISKDYSQFCSIIHLYKQMGKWMNTLEGMDFIHDILGATREYSTGFGHKNKSYWETEDDMIFRNATYKVLSREEKIIYQDLLQKSLDNINQYGIASWK